MDTAHLSFELATAKCCQAYINTQIDDTGAKFSLFFQENIFRAIKDIVREKYKNVSRIRAFQMGLSLRLRGGHTMVSLV